MLKLVLIMADPNTKKNAFARFASYVGECYKELRYKVSWPTGKELSSSAVIVLIASLIIAAFVFLVDHGFEVIVSGLYKLIV